MLFNSCLHSRHSVEHLNFFINVVATYNIIKKEGVHSCLEMQHQRVRMWERPQNAMLKHELQV